MPIYEFKCCKCSKITKEFLPITSKKIITECRECGKPAEKIISISSFKINGYSYANGYSKE